MSELPTYTVGECADWSLIPDYMIGGLRLYIERGIEPGDFLSAVLRNDLKQTVLRADFTSLHCIADYIRFLYEYAPSECWGSVEKFNRWIEHHGLAGLAGATE